MKAIKYLLLILIPLSLVAMDEPVHLKKIYVRTSDGNTVDIKRWQIDEMTMLLVLLEDQNGQNNLNNPINASMIDSEKLQLLCDALDYISLGDFESFYNQLVEKDRQIWDSLHPDKKIVPEQLLLSLEHGKLRTLFNAAEHVQAIGVTAFCLSYIMPPEIQETLVPQLIDPVISMLPVTHQVLGDHASDVFIVTFNHDGTKLASGCSGDQNNLILWDMRDPENISSTVLVGHPYNVNTAAFSRDGTKLVSGCAGQQNNLIVWDINNLQKPLFLTGLSDNVNTVALSPDGTKLIVGCSGWQNNLMIVDLSDPENIKKQFLPGHSDSVMTVGFSSDGTKFVSGSWGEDNNLIVWEIIAPENITAPGALSPYVLAGHPGNVNTVAFNPDTTKIISGSDGFQNNLIVWNISDLNALQHEILNGHVDNVHTALFNADGTKIVSGSNGKNKNLIVWDTSNPNAQNIVLHGHNDTVNRAAFGPDGTQFVSGGSGTNNNLILWNLSNLKNITHHILPGHPDSVITVAFSPDDTNIASGCWGETNSLILHQLVSRAEKQALQNCDVAQARFMYQLCLASKGSSMQLTSPYTTTVLRTLPPLIQKLLIKKLGIILP